MSLTTSWDLQGYLFGFRFVLIIIIFLGISALLGFFLWRLVISFFICLPSQAAGLV